MSIDISKQLGNAENGKIEIRSSIIIVPKSTVDSQRTDKNKDEFISVTCRYSPSAGDSKKDKYIIKAKHFETGATKDALCWYITL